MAPKILIIIALGFFMGSANAEIYRCQSGDSKTSYSDTPCKPGGTQTLIDFRTQTALNRADSADIEDKSAVVRQLDIAVKSAIANGDLIRAQALASSDEQKEWVAAAREAAKRIALGRTDADLNAEKANSDECLEAKQNLEQEVKAFSPKPSVLGAWTSMMRAACGVNGLAEADYGNQVSPVFFYPHRFHPHRRGPIIRPVENPSTHDRQRHNTPVTSKFIKPEPLK